jgi:hypothetical protein
MSLTKELAISTAKTVARWRELVHESVRTGIEPPLAAIQQAAGSGEPSAVVERFRFDAGLVAEYGMARSAQQGHLARMKQIEEASNPAEAVRAAEAALAEARSTLAIYHGFIEAAVHPGRLANHIAAKRPDLFDEAGA